MRYPLRNVRQLSSRTKAYVNIDLLYIYFVRPQYLKRTNCSILFIYGEIV